MASPRHPDLKKLHAAHPGKVGEHYRHPDGVEAIVLGDTVHAARPGGKVRSAHAKSLQHQPLHELAHKLTAPKKPQSGSSGGEWKFETHGHHVKVTWPAGASTKRIQGILDRHPPGKSTLAAVTKALANVGATFMKWADGTPGHGFFYAEGSMDSWPEVHRLSAQATGGRSDAEVLQKGLVDPAASRKAQRMADRLRAKEPPGPDLGSRRRMTPAEYKGTPGDPDWDRDDLPPVRGSKKTGGIVAAHRLGEGASQASETARERSHIVGHAEPGYPMDMPYAATHAGAALAHDHAARFNRAASGAYATVARRASPYATEARAAAKKHGGQAKRHAAAASEHRAHRGAPNPEERARFSSSEKAPKASQTNKSTTRVVLISCSKRQTKVPRGARVFAEYLYTAPLFRNCVALARTMVAKDSQIRILSGKHGLLKLTDKIPGPDFTLHDIGKAERDRWGTHVVGQMRKAFGSTAREFVFLAGELYADAISQVPGPFDVDGWRYKEPLRHESIGVRSSHVIQMLLARGITPPSRTKGR